MSVVTLLGLCFSRCCSRCTISVYYSVPTITRPSCICSHRKLFFHDDAMNMRMGGYVPVWRAKARGLGAVAGDEIKLGGAVSLCCPGPRVYGRGPNVVSATSLSEVRAWVPIRRYAILVGPMPDRPGPLADSHRGNFFLYPICFFQGARNWPMDRRRRRSDQIMVVIEPLSPGWASAICTWCCYGCMKAKG